MDLILNLTGLEIDDVLKKNYEINEELIKWEKIEIDAKYPSEILKDRLLNNY